MRIKLLGRKRAPQSLRSRSAQAFAPLVGVWDGVWRCLIVASVLLASGGLAGCATLSPNTTAAHTAVPTETETKEITRVLNALHAQAARADYDGYFALYAPGAVFLGTDRGEYWPLEEFQAYAKPHFDAGRGWTYTPLTRQLHVHNDTAWFEETLHSDSYGKVRGTGVLLRLNGQWKVAQYNLTLPIPNDLFGDIAQQIKRFYKEP